MGVRRAFWWHFMGKPSGPLGALGARVMVSINAGTYREVAGEMGSLPWEDGRFSAVAAVNVLKFAPDPLHALREMGRVLRPGGRIVITIDDFSRQTWGGTQRAGGQDSFGQWQWSDSDIQGLLGEAGFSDVRGKALPGQPAMLLVRGTQQ